MQLFILITIHKPLDHVLSNYQTKCASGRIFQAQGTVLEEILKNLRAAASRLHFLEFLTTLTVLFHMTESAK